MPNTKTFYDFELSDGTVLPEVRIVYTTYGKLNQNKDNVIWVCHALTGDTNVKDWWKGIFGGNQVLDPQKNFIVCANVIGSSYGSTNPWSSEVPEWLKGRHFPLITITDIVHGHQLLAEALEIDQIHLLIGPSLGGQQALEWSVEEPERIQNLCVIASNAKHSPWGIAFNESQRLAIWADESFRANMPDGGKYGLKTARSLALLSYRSYDAYNVTQFESNDEKKEGFFASSYQNYQGEKLVDRFNAYAYWTLSKAMDSHNVGRNRGGLKKALRKIRAKTLVIGINSDVLFPTSEQEFIANNVPHGFYQTIYSDYGHDGFLIESEKLNEVVKSFLNNQLRPHSFTTFKTTILN
ncbi:MAG: homoserine O-acetyltransferase [Fluviicola sp.]|nr:MAG: homoserine O-acetyltransferase [Fluviicola sp.]